MAVFGSPSCEENKLSERYNTSFLPHCSSKVLRGNGVLGEKCFSGVSLCQIYKPFILNEKRSKSVLNIRRINIVANTGVPANNIAKWNGSSWSALKNGVGNIFLKNGVYTITIDRYGYLFAGGSFTNADEISVSRNIQQLNFRPK